MSAAEPVYFQSHQQNHRGSKNRMWKGALPMRRQDRQSSCLSASRTFESFSGFCRLISCGSCGIEVLDFVGGKVRRRLFCVKSGRVLSRQGHTVELQLRRCDESCRSSLPDALLRLDAAHNSSFRHCFYAFINSSIDHTRGVQAASD